MKIIKLQSKQEYDSLMERLEEEGYEWYLNGKPTAFNAWGWASADDFGVCLNDNKELEYSRHSWYLKSRPQATLLTYDEYMNDTKYKVGQILVCAKYTKKILGICGEVYLMSDTDMHHRFDEGYTLEELDEAGYTLDTSDQDEEKAIQLLTERGRIKEGKIVQ